MRNFGPRHFTTTSVTPVSQHSLTGRCLIFGVTGQDGAYLARHLAARGCTVIGASRNVSDAHPNLDRLDLRDKVGLHTCSMRDLDEMVALIELTTPDVVFNLAGQTSVARSFEIPDETHASIVTAVGVMLEALRRAAPGARFYNSSTSEMFGDTPATGAHEATPFAPVSPYGLAKAQAHELVRRYREDFGLFACSGIVFNHESPLRGPQFVTHKIIRGVAEIAAGRQDHLQLGDLEVWRDWGWGPEYVEAIAAMTFAERADDYVIATGVGLPLQRFVELAFAHRGLDWRQFTRSDPGLARPSEIRFSRGDPALARAQLGWRALVDLPELIRRLSMALDDA